MSSIATRHPQELLRQRRSSATKGEMDGNNNMHNNNKERRSLRERKGGLTVRNLMQASPQHAENVYKLTVSPIFLLLPRKMQIWILSYSCLAWFRPVWKPRFLLLVGSYLYKFAAQNGAENDKQKNDDDDDDGDDPKGSPIALTSITNVYTLIPGNTLYGDDDATALFLAQRMLQATRATTETSQTAITAVFVVSTLRKKYYYACCCSSKHDDGESTSDEASAMSAATTWVNSLIEARQEAITRSMGHADPDSYPAAWKYWDSAGRSLEESRSRIRTRMDQGRELELGYWMTTNTDGALAGPMPRGYYG